MNIVLQNSSHSVILIQNLRHFKPSLKYQFSVCCRTGDNPSVRRSQQRHSNYVRDNHNFHYLSESKSPHSSSTRCDNSVAKKIHPLALGCFVVVLKQHTAWKRRCLWMRRGAGQPRSSQALVTARNYALHSEDKAAHAGLAQKSGGLPHAAAPCLRPRSTGPRPPPPALPSAPALPTCAEPSRKAAAHTNRQAPREPGPIGARYSPVLPPLATRAAVRRRCGGFWRAEGRFFRAGPSVFVSEMKAQTAYKFLTELKMLSESMKYCQGQTSSLPVSLNRVIPSQSKQALASVAQGAVTA